MSATRTVERSNDMADSKDRALGAFLGLAVGDALGTTLEFSARDRLPHHTGMTGGGPFRLAPGVWTDDTQMALALADSLLASGGLDERDLMERFVRWWRDGDYNPTGACFDIGITTRQALSRFVETGDPIAGAIAPMSAANGCIMRLAPVAIYHHRDQAMAEEAARRQSATTHRAPECLEASGWFSALLTRAINGTPKERLLASATISDGGKVGAIAQGCWRGKTRADIRSTGYVIDSLEAAVWCVDQAEDFEQALVLAVNLGDDADTVGAITGQLAGAIWGLSSIPDRWLRPLAWGAQLPGSPRLCMPGRQQADMELASAL
jgi:ADP-ribosyl-[dinitrogen reductase] hydrolase